MTRRRPTHHANVAARIEAQPPVASNVEILSPTRPMSVSGMLDNIRWENFAQALAAGRVMGKAYKESGFKPNTKSARKLSLHPVITTRVAAIRAEALANTGVTVERIIRELEKLGFSNMLDYIKIEEDGQPSLNFRELDREKAAAIGELVTDLITNPRTGEVTRRTKFKLLDKKGALVDLGRYLGMFKETKDVNHRGVIFHVNPDDMSL